MPRGLPLFLGAFSEVHIWGVPALALSSSAWLSFLAAVVFSVVLFALLALVFVPLGQLIGWYVENAPNGVFGYSVNVLASLAGILLFTFLCFLYQPPVVWFAVAGAMLAVVVWKLPALRWTALAAFVLCLGLLVLGDGSGTTVHWSPYQKLSLRPVAEEGEILSYALETNNSWYQQILNLSPQFVAEHQDLLRNVPLEWNADNLPCHFYPDPPEVLVLGAGMGNAAAAALRHGAGRVVAVEIDPLILELGRQLHFEKPYDSPRVELVVDDARSYVQASRQQFDLIVFALLDSRPLPRPPRCESPVPAPAPGTVPAPPRTADRAAPPGSAGSAPLGASRTRRRAARRERTPCRRRGCRPRRRSPEPSRLLGPCGTVVAAREGLGSRSSTLIRRRLYFSGSHDTL